MEQYIGDGATLFINIVAVLIGFGAALNVLDIRKSKPKKNSDTDHE